MTSSPRRTSATVLVADGTGTTAVLDDATVVRIPSAAIAASEFRSLRPGQRLGLELDDGPDGTVAARIHPIAVADRWT